MLSIRLLSLIAILVLYATSAKGEVCECSPKPIGSAISPTQLRQLSEILDRTKVSSSSSSENCYEALTKSDQEFINSLLGAVTSACPRENLKAEDSSVCIDYARKIWISKLIEFRALNGHAALERVLTAISASLKQGQLLAAQDIFKEPKSATLFKDFGAKMIAFNEALRLATYKDLSSSSSSALNQAIVKSRRYFGIWFDGWSYKIAPRFNPVNRFKVLKDSQTAFFAARDALRRQIVETKRGSERSLLLGQIEVLVSDLDWKTTHARDEFFETRSAIQVGAAAIGSAALIAASTGTVAAAFLGNATSRSILNSAAAGAAGGSGITGTGWSANFLYGAATDAKYKNSRFICELAQRVSKDSDRAIRETFESSLYGAGLGLGIGAAFSGAIKLAAKVSPRLAQLVGAMGGALVTASMGYDAVASELMRNSKDATRAKEIAQIEKGVQSGKASKGDLIDKKYETDKAVAQDNAKRVEAIASVALAGTSVYKLAKAPKSPGLPTGTELKHDSNVRPFSNHGTYQGKNYDLVELLPIYQEALKLHLKWARQVKTKDPVFVDAGGGTAIMTLKILEAIPNARTYLLDINEPMLAHAIAKGFPRKFVSVSNITKMLLPNGKPFRSRSVDHIYSHSVLWALENPSAFFKEARRVLKDNGTLAISTSDYPTSEILDGFIQHLHTHLTTAERSGKITQAQRENFVDNNRNLAKVLKSPLSRDELIQLGKRHGFEVVEAKDAYVVSTKNQGDRPLFNQILFRKKL
jgi:ubiquinone/menaquinone biosynthesis C-methylase UbiE